MSTRKSGTGRGVDGKPGRRYELTDQAWERIDCANADGSYLIPVDGNASNLDATD